MPVHGRLTSFKLDMLNNTLTDISNKLTNVDFPSEAELLETTTFQATGKTYMVGFKDNKISLQGRWDATIDGHLQPILGASEPTGQPAAEGFDFEYGPEGTTSGKVKYTGKAVLTKYGRTGSVNAVSGFSAELQITGDVTRTTF